MKKIFCVFLIILMSTTTMILAQSNYQNDKYGFSVRVPKDWHIYADIKDDIANNKAIIDWGLPKVYSELEKAEIENAISITAYNKREIQNIKDLTKLEFLRISNILESRKLIDSIPYHTYEIITIQNGLKYKSRVILAYKNGIGYVINFTATPGTYGVNLSKFENFVKELEFYESIEFQNQIYDVTKINIDGLYIAKTKEMVIAGKKMEIFTYLRFYDDGSVYTQAVSSYAPKNVSRWFGKNGRFEKNGRYSTMNDSISFIVNNNESPDQRIEGPLSNSFEGLVIDKDNLVLRIRYPEGEIESHEFKFVQDVAEYSIYFGHLDKKIYVPGKWQQRQIIDGGQVFIINEDSTTLGVVIYEPHKIPVYKEGMSNFEVSKAYYEWDSKYLESERHMAVAVIQEDKENAAILWNAKDDNNNSFYLFGCDGKFIYNLMIDDENLTKEDKLKMLREIFELNRR